MTNVIATDRGFALVAVLLVLALLGLVGAEFAYSMRLEASAVRAYTRMLVAGHLAEAAIDQATRELLDNANPAAVGEDGIPALDRDSTPLGDGRFTYRLTDEESRLNVNTASPEQLDRLLQALGLTKAERDTIVDSIQDWRDANEDHRLNGAESEDTYLRLPVPYRSHNGNLEAVAELLQIKGVTPAIFNGADDRPALADLVTVKTSGSVNINTAGPLVLRALGLAEAEIIEILQARRHALYTAVPGRFVGRNLAATTKTYRIDGEGLVDGRVRARLSAIVRKRSDTDPPSIVVLEWSGVR